MTMTDNDKALLSVERLRELLGYNRDTGVFIWVKSNSNRAPKGSVAGAINSDGYLQIKIDGVLHKSHRLAWLYSYVAWPSKQIDHINGDRTDNRISNLRDISPQWNSQHRVTVPTNNKCGFLGVIRRPNGRFAAEIKISGKKTHLGTFDKAEDASAAYWEAKKKLHPGVILQEK